MNIFEKLSRLFILILSYIVLCSLIYILPAIAVAVMFWDRTIYYACLTNPAYAIFIGLTALIGIAVYMVDLCDREII
jgi:hypothetical protein